MRVGFRSGNSRGFALLECLICSAILVAMVGGLFVFAQAEIVSQHEGYRQTAIALAYGEMSYLQEQADTGKLLPGKKGWLGKEDMLDQNGGRYTVQAEVKKDTVPGAWESVITISWQAYQDKGEMTFHGWVVHHVQYDPDALGS